MRGGGNFITENTPTNFHTFSSRRMLGAGESAELWREVTAKERETIEAADAKWKQPPQSFIDQWNGECAFGSSKKYFGQYNEATGYFELNGIKNIGYAEALKIWACSEHGLYAFPSLSGGQKSPFGGEQAHIYTTAVAYCWCRTYFPLKLPNYSVGNVAFAFSGNLKVETVAFVGGYGDGIGNYPSMQSTFHGCTALREIRSCIATPMNLTNTFYDCKSLELVKFYFVQPFTVDLHWSPKLSEESLRYLVKEYSYKQDAAQSTVILHQDVFDRLPDDLVEQAAAKNIIFTTA